MLLLMMLSDARFAGAMMPDVYARAKIRHTPPDQTEDVFSATIPRHYYYSFLMLIADFFFISAPFYAAVLRWRIQAFAYRPLLSCGVSRENEYIGECADAAAAHDAIACRC
jgi:hypothetical protein